MLVSQIQLAFVLVSQIQLFILFISAQVTLKLTQLLALKTE